MRARRFSLSALALPMAALLMSSLACFPGPATPTTTPLPSPTETPATPPTPEGPLPVSSRIADLASATVQILAMVHSGGGFSSVWSGSGTIISPEGLILTNAHVVDERYGEYTDLGIAVLETSDQPPDLAYLAEIAAVDYGLDLAVIRIVSDLDGNPVSLEIPFVTVGNSDEVEIGDPLRILGYPGIGGETITFTEGAVSGFTSDRSVSGRAWIKTDATIAGGNSGGLGANESGELIGVPTLASSGAEDAEIVDCRPVVDTNRDGRVDDNDTCVPIGGFINGLRPVNLALPLIEAARSGAIYQAAAGSPAGPAGGFDTSDTLLSSLVFSDGVTDDNQPTRVLPSLPRGASDVCAFWDFEGMADGMTWSGYWYVNGQMDEDGSIVNDTWVGGTTGSWWVCIHNAFGLPDGLYEIVIEVEGETMATDAVFVGGNHPLVDFTLVNQTEQTVRYVQLSPSEARNWGQNDLDGTETLRPGASRTFEVPAGAYDLRVIDADIHVLTEDYGLDLTRATSYTLTPGGGQPSTGGPITVTLHNQLSLPVCFVFMSPTSNPSWGSNWLSASEIIQPGANQGFAVPTDEPYDLQARDCNQNVLDERYGVQIPAGGYAWTLSGASTPGTTGAPTVRIANQLSETVCYVYISPSTQSTWGENWLGPNEAIFPAGYRDFSVTPGLAYDFKVEDCDHNPLGEVYAVQVTGQGYTWTLSP
jgi:S1-C subfamily serine protease